MKAPKEIVEGLEEVMETGDRKLVMARRRGWRWIIDFIKRQRPVRVWGRSRKDRMAIEAAAFRLGKPEVAEWMMNHRGEYLEGLQTGFEAE